MRLHSLSAWPRSTRLGLICGIVLSLTSVTALSAQAGLPSAETLTRQPKLFQVASGGSRRFTADLSVCQYVEILLESSAPGVDLAVLSADGGQLKAVSSGYPGWLALSFPTAEGGPYQIVLQYRSTEVPADRASVHLSFVCSSGSGAKNLIEADGLLARSQALSHSLRVQDLRRAISDDEQARVIWMQAADPEGEILALAGEAQVQLGLSQYSRALETLARARNILTTSSYWQAWLANLQAQVYLDRWDSENATSKAEEAVELSASIKDEWLTANALASRGESKYLTHQSSSKTDIEDSLRIAKEIQAVGTMARALRCEAWIEKDESHLTHASALMEGAREYFHRQGEVRSELQAMSTLANISNSNGDPYSSLLRHTKLAELFRQSGSTSHYAILLENIGTDYHSLNRLDDAIIYFRKALEAYRNVGHRSGQALALSELCSTEMDSKRMREALLDCSAEGLIVKQFHDPKRTAIATWHLGKVQFALGRTMSAIECFQRAEAISETVHDTRFAAQALLDLGGAEASLGRWQEAEEIYTKGLSLSRISENVSLQVEAIYQIARIDVQRGNTVGATRNLDDALKAINTLRRSVRNAELQAAYFARVRKCHDLYVQALMNEHDRSHWPLSADNAARALEMNEAGSALTLLDAITARNANSEFSTRRSVADASTDLHQAVERAYDQRLRLMVEGARGAELDANASRLSQAIDSLERDEDEQEADLNSTSWSGQTASAARLLDASRQSDATFVEYALGSDHSYAWVVEKGKIESHVLPGRNRLISLVRKWRALATARNSRPGEDFETHQERIEQSDRRLPTVGAKLSCLLIGSFLKSTRGSLVIVPDGELYQIPFAALPENGCEGGRVPLIVKRQVLITPSLTVLLAPKKVIKDRPNEADVLLFADPVFDREDPRLPRRALKPDAKGEFPLEPALPRLIGTRDEAKAIVALAGSGRATLYVDFDASLQNLLNPSSGAYRILHLASHGVLDEAMPSSSGIVLSLFNPEGQPVFGYLKAHDISRLDLPYDLVVLSSCDSAAGVNLSGEGVEGLSHAFLSAGSRRVISTLWSVDDEASKRFMISFYTGMLREGLDPAAAVRKSEIDMIRGTGMKAPYYWAAFNLTSIIN